MDKFLNVATGQPEEVPPNGLSEALVGGTKVINDENGNAVEAPAEATHAPIPDEHYTMYDPKTLDAYDVPGKSFLDMASKGFVPNNPVLQELSAFKSKLNSEGDIGTAKSLAFQLASGMGGDLNKSSAGQAILGGLGYDKYDQAIIEGKQAILADRSGTAGKIANFVGGIAPALYSGGLTGAATEGLAPSMFSRAGAALAPDAIVSSLAGAAGKDLTKTITGRIVSAAARGAIGQGEFNLANEGIKSLIPTSEDEFQDPALYGEMVVSRIGNALDSTPRAMALGVAFGTAEGGIKEAGNSLWQMVLNFGNTGGKSLGDFADTSMAGYLMGSEGEKAAQAKTQGAKSLQNQRDALEASWDKDIPGTDGKKLFNSWIQSSKSLAENTATAAEKYGTELGTFADDVSKKYGPVFDPQEFQSHIDGYLKNELSPIEQKRLGPVIQGYMDLMPEYGMDRPFDFNAMREFETTVSKDGYSPDSSANTSEKIAAQNLADAASDYMQDKLEEIGTKSSDPELFQKYQDLKDLKGGYEKAKDAWKSAAASKFGRMFPVGVGATAMLGAYIVSRATGVGRGITPEQYIGGGLATAFAIAYGHQASGMLLKSISNNAESVASKVGDFTKQLGLQSFSQGNYGWAKPYTIDKLGGLFGVPNSSNNAQVIMGINSKLSNLIGNPDVMQDALQKATGATTDVAPQTTSSMQQTVARGINYLNSVIPKPDNTDPISASEFHVNDTQMNKFSDAVTGVMNPEAVLKNISKGTATQAQIDAFKNTYPGLYSYTISQATQKIATTPDIKYLTKVQLGLMLDKPVTTSMQPGNITLLQNNFTKQNGPGRPKSTSKMASFGKANETQTNAVANGYVGQ